MTTDCQRPHPGIGCFVVRNGRFLMGRRRGAHGAGTWSVPGGWIEYGESPEDAAIREVREETGMLVEDARVAGATTTSHAEGMCSVTLWMVARWRCGEPVVTEPDKYVEHRWYGLDEALPTPLFEVWRDLLGSAAYGEVLAMLIEAPGIPHTRTGKKLEVPICGVLAGRTDVSLDPRSIDNPDVIDWYRERGRDHRWR